jgi:hypothetical protein
MDEEPVILIECSPKENIVYTMTKVDAEILSNALEMWKNSYGKYPRVQDIINFINKTYGLKESGVFKNIKIEKKKKEEIKGMVGSYIFHDEPINI